MEKRKQVDDLRVRVKAGKRIRELNLDKELEISEVDINNQMMSQPRMFAWVAVLAKLAADTKRHKKANIKVVYAELDKHWRNYRESSKLRVTERIIESDILGDEKYQKAMEELHSAEFNYDLLEAVVESFIQRKDMLISVASNLRAERDTNLSVLKDKAKTMRSK